VAGGVSRKEDNGIALLAEEARIDELPWEMAARRLNAASRELLHAYHNMCSQLMFSLQIFGVPHCNLDMLLL
jgi:hypothetical protein